MNNLVSNYVKIMKKEDIIAFARKNHLIVSDQEINFVYNFIKNNYQTYLNNPNSFDLSQYKDKFSKENYDFLNNLINKYKRMIF